MSFEKLPTLDGRGNPCFNCPSIPKKAPMTKGIAVGFGSAFVSCDGKLVLDGEAQWQSDQEPPTFDDAERLALLDPDHDWRVHLHGPMHGEVYQRQGVEEWLLVEKDEGFA